MAALIPTAKAHLVIVPDLRGFGDRPARGGYDKKTLAADIHQVSRIALLDAFLPALAIGSMFWLLRDLSWHFHFYARRRSPGRAASAYFGISGTTRANPAKSVSDADRKSMIGHTHIRADAAGIRVVHNSHRMPRTRELARQADKPMWADRRKSFRRVPDRAG